MVALHIQNMIISFSSEITWICFIATNVAYGVTSLDLYIIIWTINNMP
jgi:hypothetical protein